MLDRNTIDEIVDGAVEVEARFASVALDYEETRPLTELDYYHKISYMRETWRTYLMEWLEENEQLIEVALEAYNKCYEYPAWNFGIEVAHKILDSGRDFYTEKIVDAELADKLNSSLDSYLCPLGMHEVWVENSELHVTRWQ